MSLAAADPPLPPGEARGLTSRRRGLGVLLAVLLLPALTGALVAARHELSLGSVLLLYLLAVVVISLVGGLLAGVAAALASFLLANFFLTPPYHTFVVESRDSVIALVVFLLVTVTVSALVDAVARRQTQAARSDAEAVLLGRVAAEPLNARAPEAVLAQVAATFGLTSVELATTDPPEVLARFGPPLQQPGTVRVDAGPDRVLRGDGPQMFAEDRRLLGSLAHAASRAVDVQTLSEEASRARALAEVDRLRSALLAAVGHDLRTPLAGVKAAVTTLRQPDMHLDEADRAELLSTIDGSADRLGDLIANLLDLSRLQAGALSIDLGPVAVDEVVARALIDRHFTDVANDVPDDLAYVTADAGLLERVVANLVDNAHRHTAQGTNVRIAARSDDATVTLTVTDHGPGVPEADWDRMFVPFQRLDDRTTTTGVGLGLAIARGFTEAMGGDLQPAQTAGGGLSMIVTLPRAGRSEPAGVRPPAT